MAKLDYVNYKGTIAEIVPEIAPLFKTTETYAAGDHVIYEADWYTFKEAKEAGAWDATKVDGPFKVANEIVSLKEDLNAEVPVSSLTWEIGTLNPGAGVENPSSARIRSEYIPVTEGTTITLSGNANCLIVYCYKRNKVYVSDSAWTDGNKFIVPSGVGYIRVVIRKSASDQAINSDEIYTLAERCSINLRLNQDIFGMSEFQLATVDNVTNIENLQQEELHYNSWEQGSIALDGSNFYVNNRIRTTGYISLDGIENLTIGVESGYKFVVDWFDDNNSIVSVNQTGAWRTGFVTYSNWNGPTKATKIRLLMATTSDDAVNVNIVDNITIKYSYPLLSNINRINDNLGLIVSSFNVSSGSAHSSTKDRIDVDINANETFYVSIVPNVASSKSLTYQIYAINDANESTAVYTGFIKDDAIITATEHIKQIGIYISTPSENTTFKIYIYLDGGVFYKFATDKEEPLFVSSAYNADDIGGSIESYSSLFKNGSEDVDAFLFFTDPHIFEHTVLENKMELAIGTLEYVFNNCSAEFVLCGGDWLQASDTQDEACYKLGRINGIMRAKFGENYYPIIGNHDTNYQGKTDSNAEPNTGELPQTTLDNLWFSKYGKAYYDFKTLRTRYYVFDTGTDWQTAMTDYRWEQVDWFANKLMENDDSHSVIALHIFSNQFTASNFDTDPRIQLLAENLTLVAQAYNSRTTVTLNGETYDFTGKTGKVSYMICGHSHYDKVTTYNSIPVIMTVNAGYNPNFDLLYVDYDNALLSAVRVGSGSNRSMSIIV